MSNTREFENKRPYSHNKQDLYTLSIISGVILSLLVGAYFLWTPYTPSKLDKIMINTSEKIIGRDYVNCSFQLESKDNTEDISTIWGDIKYRGFTAKYWEKKGYRIELDQEVSLLGMRKDDDWLLLSMYLDFPRTRIKLSLDLWRSLLSTNPTAMLPKSEYVSLHVNGQFEGLYLLCEKNDRRLFGLDDAKTNINSSFIIQSKTYSKLGAYWPKAWEQDWPNEEDGIYIMDEIMTDLISFIVGSNDNDFFNRTSGVYSIFDELNLIDFFLFGIFQNHKDFWHRNYFMVRNTFPNKIFLIPWDFDGCFGQYGWKQYSPHENLNDSIEGSTILINRLMNNTEFMKNCSKRWKALRETLWTKSFIFDLLSDIYEEIDYDLEIDLTMWKPKTVREDPGTDWPDKLIYGTEQFDLDYFIDDLYDFIARRLKYLDSYFESIA